MSLSVTFRRAARAEFIEAAAWYESQWPDLGVDFIAEIERCLDVACAVYDLPRDSQGCSPCRCQSVSIQRVLSSGRTSNRRFGAVPRQARPRNLAAPYLRTDNESSVSRIIGA
jgi:hypothetical protein